MSDLASRADVIACYQNLLNREPESEAVIQWHLAQRRSFWELVRHFSTGDEFIRLNRLRRRFVIYNFLQEPYLANSFVHRAKYIAFCNNYSYLNYFVASKALENIFDNYVVLFRCEPTDVEYRIELTIKEGATPEGEVSLRFEADKLTLFATEFSIVPGVLVGAAERHVILIAHMQGWGEPSASIRPLPRR